MVYSDAIEDKIDQIIPALKKRYPDLPNYRWHALKLLEGDKEITEKYPVDLPQVLDRSYESDIINQKYDFIGEIIDEVLLHKERQDLLTERADRLLTSKDVEHPHLPGHHGGHLLPHLHRRGLAQGLLWSC